MLEIALTSFTTFFATIGPVEAAVLSRGAQLVREAAETWHIRVEVVSADPSAHEAWLGAMKEAIGRTLSTLTP